MEDKIFIVKVRSPKTNDKYFGKRPSDNELVIVEAGFNYDLQIKQPVILAEFEGADYGYVIETLTKHKESYDSLFKSFGKDKNTELYENYVKETTQLQSAINLLQTLGEGK